MVVGVHAYGDAVVTQVVASAHAYIDFAVVRVDSLVAPNVRAYVGAVV